MTEAELIELVRLAGDNPQARLWVRCLISAPDGEQQARAELDRLRARVEQSVTTNTREEQSK